MNNNPAAANPGDASLAPRRWRRWLSRFLLGAAIGITVLCAIVAFENWRGRRAWRAFERDCAARQEPLELSAFRKVVAPADDFSQTPFWLALVPSNPPSGKRGLFEDATPAQGAVGPNIFLGNGKDRPMPKTGSWDRRGETIDWQVLADFYRGNTNYPPAASNASPPAAVLTALSRFDPLLAELRSATARPQATYPLRYEDGSGHFMASLGATKSVGLLLRLRAAAWLEMGRPEEALQDVQVLFRVVEMLQDEPVLITELVRVAVISVTLQPVWEGLAKHQWKAQQLEVLQGRLSQIPMLSHYARTLRAERALSLLISRELGAMALVKSPAEDGGRPGRLGLFQRFAVHATEGFFLQNALTMARLHPEVLIPVIDPGAHRLYPDRLRGAESHPLVKNARPYNIFARMLLPALDKFAWKCARSQTSLDEAVVACALERFRLAEGKYPDGLDALVPRFLDRVPNDVVDGKPLRYRRGEGDGFVLYSIGMDERDDQGSWIASRPPEPEKGDWVWRYPKTDAHP